MQCVSFAGLRVSAGALGGALLGGCVAGEHELGTTLTVQPVGAGTFGAYTDISVDGAPTGVSATLQRVSMTAPEGVPDLTFFRSIVGSGLDPATGEAVPLAQGANFPPNDTIGVLQVIYTGDLRRFINQDTQKIRIIWKGTVDTTRITIPTGGALIDILIDINAD